MGRGPGDRRRRQALWTQVWRPYAANRCTSASEDIGLICKDTLTPRFHRVCSLVVLSAHGFYCVAERPACSP